MNARIANFERLWVATVLPPLPPPLVRSTNAYWGLSREDQERWTAETTEGRNAIEREHRIKNNLDLYVDLDLDLDYIPTPVPYYECDDDDMLWIE